MTLSAADLEPLVAALARGTVVAIATESFFGLLADAERPDAIERLLSLKPRGADKGMPLVLPSKDAWGGLVTAIPPAASVLAHAFWPGGLSIALRLAPGVDSRLGLDGRVAVREPGPSPARELVRAYGRPLTATSANLPGQPPATTAEAVEGAFPQALKDATLTVWRDPAPGGLPSTVVVFDADRVWIARAGAVPRAAIVEVLRTTGAQLDAIDPRG